jgi:hypothetical protein
MLNPSSCSDEATGDNDPPTETAADANTLAIAPLSNRFIKARAGCANRFAALHNHIDDLSRRHFAAGLRETAEKRRNRSNSREAAKSPEDAAGLLRRPYRSPASKSAISS